MAVGTDKKYHKTIAELKNTYENTLLELQDAVKLQKGMILKFIQSDDEFIHTLAEGELVYRIGLTPAQIIGKKMSDLLTASEAKRKSDFYERAWQGEENVTYEGELNGVHYLASLRPIRQEGQVIEVIASCVDITERIECEKRFQKMTEYSLTGVVIYSEKEVLYTNPASRMILREDVAGMFMKDSLQGTASSFARQLEIARDCEKNFSTFDQRLKIHDGTMIDVNIALIPIHYENQQAILALFSDETNRRNAERTFEQATKELNDVNFALNESSIVAITNRRGIIQFVNEKFCEISQYTKEELIGQDHRILNSGHHAKSFFMDMWKTIARGETWRGEICNRAKDGTFYWVHTTIVPFLDEKGMPYQYVAIRTDITERKKVEEALRLSEEKLTYLAYHDPLTNLPNRRYFIKHLQKAIDEAAEKNKEMSVVYMDMDRFKYINDTFGHEEGDRVLSEFARRINTCLPPDVLFSRQGGDEFTLIIPNAGEEEVIQLANQMIHTLKVPIYGHTQLTASIGIAFYPKHGFTKDALMRCADKAMYAAKHDGRNNYKIFAPEMG